MRALVLGAALVLAACSGSTTSPTAPPATAASSPAASGTCIDRETFAEDAEVVMTTMQGLVADLKASNALQAKADAGTLATGLRKLADLVDAVQPEAAQDFRDAATGIDSAVSEFPGGQSLVDKAQADLSAGLTLASNAECPA
jgi:hypothetical protein